MGADAAKEKDCPKDMEREHESHPSSIPRQVAVYSFCVPDQARKRAEVVIPQAWLVPNLTIDAVRALQPGETTADLERGDLRMRGVEVLVARNWVKEEFWPRIHESVQTGYAAEKTHTYLRAHAERRGTRRVKKQA